MMTEKAKLMFNSAFGRFSDNRANEIMKELKKEITGTPEEEVWEWVEGYKGTDANMCCRGTQFELGKQFDMPEGEEIELCGSGFHFCPELKDVFGYYGIGEGNRFFKVRALVRKKKELTKEEKEELLKHRLTNPWGYYLKTQDFDADKNTSKSIVFERECTIDEIFEANCEKYPSSDAKYFTDEQKKKALEISIPGVMNEIRNRNLAKCGYSEALITYLIQKGDSDMIERAIALDKQPGISMDVKVLSIFVDND